MGKIASTSHSSHSCVCVHAQGLAFGMEVKHATYNTGFSGAKLVCASATPVSEWNDKDKTHLMNVAASLLEELDGAMYTGCDMNVTTKDMDYLSEKCPYVLAAVGNDATCPNKATAYGVLGAVEATLGGSVEGKKLLVHGCGGVGAYVAAELVELGAASVKTVDMTKEKADIAGCVRGRVGTGLDEPCLDLGQGPGLLLVALRHRADPPPPASLAPQAPRRLVSLSASLCKLGVFSSKF